MDAVVDGWKFNYPAGAAIETVLRRPGDIGDKITPEFNPDRNRQVCFLGGRNPELDGITFHYRGFNDFQSDFRKYDRDGFVVQNRKFD